MSDVQQLQAGPPNVPVPGRNPLSRPWILQRLVLQPAGLEPQLAPERKEPLSVYAHDMGHRLVVDPMAMKPHAAVEGKAHSLAAAYKFAVETVYEQEMLPSIVAVPTGAAAPEKR